MSEPAFVVTYAVSEDVFVRASRTGSLTATRWTNVAVIVAGFGIAVWILGWPALIGGAIGGLVAAWLVVGVMIPRRARAIYRETPSLRLATTLALFADRLEFSSINGTSRTPWADWLKWQEGADVLLLYLNRSLYFIIPKPALSGAALAFMRDRLLASGLTASGKVRAQ